MREERRGARVGRPGPRGHVHRLGVPLALALLASSCAYYNTFYLARRYYDKATAGMPYVVEKADPQAAVNFGKSIDYSKKLIAHHAKSKWVDDAYLLWARALLGREDPSQTVNMLKDFSARYPQSPLKDEALFYLGVGARKARQYSEARTALEEFLQRQPNHPLASYAYLEQSHVYMALQRPADAAVAASQMLERFPKSRERDRAFRMRAEALLAKGDHQLAREDYQMLGTRATSDEERFGLLLKEADCLEAGRLYDEELVLLRTALAHEQEPQRQAPPAAPVAAGQTNPGNPNPPPAQQSFTPFGMTPTNERWGRLMLKVGTVQTLQGKKDEALGTLQRVLTALPQTPHAAEAQYRIGYVYETVADDLPRAQDEYARVAKLSATSPFSAQATRRLQSLERLAQFRTSTGKDSVARKAEAGFLLAELYLFQNDKPERALEQYRSIVDSFPRTPYAGKALNAEAWVLRRKLERPVEADSLLWIVIRNYPKTEAQLHARDYLEAAGHMVPDSLIQPPEAPPPPPVDTTLKLTPPPVATDTLGPRRPVAITRDTPASRSMHPDVVEDRTPPPARDTTRAPSPAPVDTTTTPLTPARPDTTRKGDS